MDIHAVRATVTEQGFALLPALFSAEQVRQATSRFSEYVAVCQAAGASQPIPGVPGASVHYEPGFDPVGKSVAERELGIRKVFQFAEADPLFWSLARHPGILALLEALLGANCQLLQSMSLFKPPEIGGAKHWHQDTPYFPITPADEAIGFWIALDDATHENGCMQLVPGSHRQIQPHVMGPSGWMLPPEVSARCAAQAVALPMPAGSAVVFNANTCHFTDANRTTLRRRALQLHYVSARTRATDVNQLTLYPLASVKAPKG